MGLLESPKLFGRYKGTLDPRSYAGPENSARTSHPTSRSSRPSCPLKNVARPHTCRHIDGSRDGSVLQVLSLAGDVLRRSSRSPSEIFEDLAPLGGGRIRTDEKERMTGIGVNRTCALTGPE